MKRKRLANENRKANARVMGETSRNKRLYP